MTVQEIAEQSLKSLLASLGFSAEVEITETDGIICLNVSSPDSRYIIGNDGDRLDDLQYLVNRMIQRNAFGRASTPNTASAPKSRAGWSPPPRATSCPATVPAEPGRFTSPSSSQSGTPGSTS